MRHRWHRPATAGLSRAVPVILGLVLAGFSPALADQAGDLADSVSQALTPAQIADLVLATKQAEMPAEAIDDLRQALGVEREVAIALLRILETAQIPQERLIPELAESAAQYHGVAGDLSTLQFEDADGIQMTTDAQLALRAGRFDEVERQVRLLEERDMAAGTGANGGWDATRLRAAQARTLLGKIALMRQRYDEAADSFRVARERIAMTPVIGSDLAAASASAAEAPRTVVAAASPAPVEPAVPATAPVGDVPNPAADTPVATTDTPATATDAAVASAVTTVVPAGAPVAVIPSTASPIVAAEPATPPPEAKQPEPEAHPTLAQSDPAPATPVVPAQPATTVPTPAATTPALAQPDPTPATPVVAAPPAQPAATPQALAATTAPAEAKPPEPQVRPAPAQPDPTPATPAVSAPPAQPPATSSTMAATTAPAEAKPPEPEVRPAPAQPDPTPATPVVTAPPAQPGAAPPKEAPAMPVPAPVVTAMVVPTQPLPRPAPPIGDVVAKPATARPLDAGMLDLLLKRGDAMLALGDLAAARLLYERAAAAGDSRGAIGVGRTYDPKVLLQIGARGIQADPDRAAAWYHKAQDLGDTTAAAQLRQLGR